MLWRPSLVEAVSYRSVRPHPPASSRPRLTIRHSKIFAQPPQDVCAVLQLSRDSSQPDCSPPPPKAKQSPTAVLGLPSRGDHASLVLGSLLFPLSHALRSCSGEEQQ